MTNGTPKPPPGFQIVGGSNVPPPPPGFVIQPGESQDQQSRLQRLNQLQRNIRDAFAEGITLGFMPELMAGVDAMMQGIPYSEALAAEEARMSQIPSGQRLAGNIVGGLVSAPALGLSVPGGVAQATRQGAGLGALAGAGFTEGGALERGAGAAAGGALGGLVGGGSQALIGAIGRAVARLRQGVDRPTARAMDQVLREMNAGEITPEQAINRVQRLGPEGMLADVPELQRLAQQTAARTAAGQRVAGSALAARRAAAGQRVENALDIVLEGRDTRAVRDAIFQTRKAEAGELYRQALDGDALNLTDDLAALVGGEGRKGSPLVRGQLESIRRSNPRFQGRPDTDRELLHATRVALADRGKIGTTPGQRNILDVTNQLTDAMDDAGATGYRQAVDQYRTDSLTLEAFDKGRKALNQLPEDVARFMRSASQSEQDAFVAGLGREVLRNLETGETRAATTGVRSIFRGERAQVLREVLGPERYAALRNRLLREIRFAETGTRVLGGSPTQPREAAAQEAARNLGRAERAARAIRGQGSVIGAAAELATPRGAPNIGQERALSQLLFRSQGQGLGQQRFAGRTPLLELAMRQRLLQGGATPAARAAVPGGAGAVSGQAAPALLNFVGF